MRPLVRAVLRGSLRQVRYVDVIAPRRARGLVAQVYRRTERDFGVLAPPVALHSCGCRIAGGDLADAA